MSFRKKTIKFGETYGTPTETTITTPKAPSPKKPKIVKTINGGVVSVSTPTAPRTAPRTDFGYGVTPTAAGIVAQEQFKSQIQTSTAPIREGVTAIQYLTSAKAHYGVSTGVTEAEKQIKSLFEYAAKFDAHHPHLEVIAQQIQDLEPQIIIQQKEMEKAGIELGENVKQIIEAIESGKVLAPDYFHNNIIWVQSGEISNKAFLDSYYYLSNQGIIHSAPIEPIIEEIIEEPIIELPELLPEVSAEPDSTITDNMVTQQVINFNIVNGRAVGSIKFVATNNFNPYYYNKNIVNIIQFKDPNGANILTYVKENRLNFTETERDEVISYDEDMKGNTRATVESVVWSSATQPTAFSKKYSIEISEAEPPKPITSGFMGAGIAGAIAGLVLIGFIADHKRGK